jgi:hypothetical protein
MAKAWIEGWASGRWGRDRQVVIWLSRIYGYHAGLNSADPPDVIIQGRPAPSKYFDPSLYRPGAERTRPRAQE